MIFSEVGLNKNIQKAIKDLGFVELTPIQKEAIPYLINGDEDLIALAQTGTGKTAAFGLPIIEKIEIKIVNNLKEESGFGIVVCDDNKTKLERKTNAKYFLLSTVQVESFLNQLLQVC